jgi:transcription elongation factor GreA
VEDRLARAQVIELDQTNPPDDVRFGVTVVLLDTESDEQASYTLVGEDESDASLGRISVSSPIARALIGKRVDDEVTVNVPKGKRQFEVLEINVTPDL